MFRRIFHEDFLNLRLCPHLVFKTYGTPVIALEYSYLLVVQADDCLHMAIQSWVTEVSFLENFSGKFRGTILRTILRTILQTIL